MEKLKMLLDVDEVICFMGMLEAVNEFLGTSYEIDDFTDYYIDGAVIKEENMPRFNEFLKTRNLYEPPKLLPHAIEVLERLSKVVDIYICTSCVNPFDVENSGKLFLDKYNFLIKYLPFLDPKKFIFTGAKQVFKMDIQVDDRLSNLDEQIEYKILFPSYHNKNITQEELDEKNAMRAGVDWRNGWTVLEDMVMKIVEEKRLAEQSIKWGKYER